MALVWTVNRRLVGLAATVSVLLSVGAWILSRKIPLPPPPDISFISTYGVVDNRRVLLCFAGLVLAAILGPLLARIWLYRSRWLQVFDEMPDKRNRWQLEKRHLLLVFLIAVLALLFLGSWVSHAPLNSHELVHLGYLSEVSHGRVLNVDTRVTYGPLLGYSIYGFMKLSSFDLVGFRKYWNFVTFLTLSLLLLLLYKHLTHKLWLVVFLLYALVYTTARYHLSGADGTPIGTWGWANLLRHGIFPIAILWLWNPLVHGKRWWPKVILGALPLFAGAYYQELGSMGALTAALLLTVASGGHWRILFTRDVPLALGGAVVAFLLVSGPAIAQGELGTFFDATWRAPALFLQGAGNLNYPSLMDTDRSALSAALPYFLVPALILVLLSVTLGFTLSGKRRFGLHLCLWSYATFSYLTVLIRGDSSHLANIMIAPLLASTLLADEIFRGRWFPSKTWLVPAAAAVLVALLGLGNPGLSLPIDAVSGRIFHGGAETIAGWERMPFERGNILTPAGAWYESDAFGESDPRAIELMRGLSKGEPTVVFGNVASLYYYLADLPAAVPYTDMSSQAQTKKDRDIMKYAFLTARPTYAYLVKVEMQNVHRRHPGYRLLGYTSGLYVLQREDLSFDEALATGLIDRPNIELFGDRR